VSKLRVPIERSRGFPADFEERHRATRTPLVVSLDNWPQSTVDPKTLKARFADVQTHATVQLSETGVVYLQADSAHRRAMRVGDFVDLMDSGATCYIDQANIEVFPGLADSMPLQSLLPSGRRVVNVWIGSRTRSGLHYDPMDNYLLQLYGEKQAILAAPSDRKGLYPFADNVSKSRIDPEIPDVEAFPLVKDVTFFTATLNAGELLYIPRGWWHFLRAPAQSITVNIWHDPALSVEDELEALRAVGVAGWMKIARDFVWHGALRRPYLRRLYSPPPTGKQLYDLAVNRILGTLRS
jgi:hypothetical protein